MSWTFSVKVSYEQLHSPLTTNELREVLPLLNLGTEGERGLRTDIHKLALTQVCRRNVGAWRSLNILSNGSGPRLAGIQQTPNHIIPGETEIPHRQNFKENEQLFC